MGDVAQLSQIWVDRTRRPEIIARTYPKAFDGSQLHVIVGARDEWRSFLKKFTRTGGLELQQYKDERGRLMYETCMEDRRLPFAFFDIFMRGIEDRDILGFGSIVSPLIPNDLRQRVKLFA